MENTQPTQTCSQLFPRFSEKPYFVSGTPEKMIKDDTFKFTKPNTWNDGFDLQSDYKNCFIQISGSLKNKCDRYQSTTTMKLYEYHWDNMTDEGLANMKQYMADKFNHQIVELNYLWNGYKTPYKRKSTRGEPSKRLEIWLRMLIANGWIANVSSTEMCLMTRDNPDVGLINFYNRLGLKTFRKCGSHCGNVYMIGNFQTFFKELVKHNETAKAVKKLRCQVKKIKKNWKNDYEIKNNLVEKDADDINKVNEMSAKKAAKSLIYYENQTKYALFCQEEKARIIKKKQTAEFFRNLEKVGFQLKKYCFETGISIN
jgi:hypothetical protein